METLMESTVGAYRVRTFSSTYLLDLDRDELWREPNSPDPLEATPLRHDGDLIRLVDVLACTVGERMILLIDLGVPGVECTTRVSEPVISIERLAAAPEVTHA